MLGESLSDVAAWAHRANTQTTEIYAHMQPHGQPRADPNRRRVDTMWTHSLRRTMGRD